MWTPSDVGLARRSPVSGETVRSSRLLAVQIQTAGDVETGYTTPQGIIAIIKEVVLYNGTGGEAQMQLLALPSGAPTNMQLVSELVSAGTAFRLETWTVLEPTDVLQCYSDTPGVKFYVSGTQLIQSIAP